MKKKLLSIICAFLLVTSLGVLWVSNSPAYAEESVKYYYGTSLASSLDGSTNVASSLANGLEITFGKASKESSAQYSHTLDMTKFGVEFYFTNDNFEELWFKFTDNDNDSKWVQIFLKKQDGKIHYKFKDNYSNETEYKDSGLNVSMFTDRDSANVAISYDASADAKFVLSEQNLDTGDIQTLSFYKNIAKMSFGVIGVSGDEDQNDTVIRLMSITNSNGKQTLETSDSKFTGENRVAPIIIPMEDGNDEHIKAGDSDPTAIELKGASNSEYTFPYYCIDTLGTGWQVETTDSNEQTTGDKEADKVAGKTKHALGKAGTTYQFKIYTLYADEHPALILNVTSVDDAADVIINKAAFDAFINGSKELSGDIIAPKSGNTFEFPHIYRENFAEKGADATGKVLQAADDLDTFYNIKIQVGYRAPGDSGEFNYVSAYAVNINKTGMWSFRYKITDAAGNETESDVFQRRVLDEDPPVIKVDKNVEITVNQKYTIPTANIDDNASGVDTAYSKWKLFALKSDGTWTDEDEIKNLKEGDEGYSASLLKDGVLTPNALTPADKDASYVLVYYARDLDGNETSAEVMIKVVAGTPTYAPNPWNDFFRTALIVIACLAGTGIIVLIFLRPKNKLTK